jgi:hypothetical protein
MDLDLARDVLDQQLIDRNGTKMGRVDGLVIAFEENGRPRVDHFELGFAVLACRIHPRLERWLDAIRRRWSVRKVARQIVPWSDVAEVTENHIKLTIDAFQTPAFDWERWLRDHVVTKIPGSGDES